MIKDKKFGRDTIVFSIFFVLIVGIMTIGYNVNYFISAYAHILNYAYYETSLTLQITSKVKTSIMYYDSGNTKEYQRVYSEIFSEDGQIDNFFTIMEYLEHGNEELGLPVVTGKNILQAMDEANIQMIKFVDYIELISASPNRFSPEDDLAKLDEITVETYNSIDNVINEFEYTYYIYSFLQKSVIVSCLILVIVVTAYLLILNKKVIRVENIAKHDFLTGLHSIGYLKSLTNPYVDDSYALIFIDVNKFKQINDTFGHRTGDDILRTLGRRLKTLFKGNLSFRYGGDEFIIFIKKENTHLLEQYVSAINRDVFSPITDHNGTIHDVTGSVGAIGAEVEKINIHAAVNQADSLMYVAKSKGFDTCLVAHTDPELKILLNSCANAKNTNE